MVFGVKWQKNQNKKKKKKKNKKKRKRTPPPPPPPPPPAVEAKRAVIKMIINRWLTFPFVS